MFRVVAKRQPFKELDGVLPKSRWRSLLLPAYATIHVPPMCFATVPHGLTIASDPDCLTWITLTPRQDVGLLLAASAIPDGEVVTTVFNITTRQIKIPRGSLVSRIISVELE